MNLRNMEHPHKSGQISTHFEKSAGPPGQKTYQGKDTAGARTSPSSRARSQDRGPNPTRPTEDLAKNSLECRRRGDWTNRTANWRPASPCTEGKISICSTIYRRRLEPDRK